MRGAGPPPFLAAPANDQHRPVTGRLGNDRGASLRRSPAAGPHHAGPPPVTRGIVQGAFSGRSITSGRWPANESPPWARTAGPVARSSGSVAVGLAVGCGYGRRSDVSLSTARARPSSL